MLGFSFRKEKTFPHRVWSVFFSVIFFLNVVTLPTGIYAQSISKNTFSLPLPGMMITPTDGFEPPIITGIVINPQDPLEFEFMIDSGENELEGADFQAEAQKMIKYFLATMTIPEEKLWVNLSPYEKDQMISSVFGETEMGRDLLGQDYILKQLTASLMNPEEELGKEAWERIYAKAYEIYGTREVPVDMFNKVWIIPDKATIYENEMGAFIVESRLKVMLEEDYLALSKNADKQRPGRNDAVEDGNTNLNRLTTEVIRNVIVPEIEKEVNEGSTFANLRQIYSAMILASWYKKNLRESFLGQVYVDQYKIAGIDLEDKTVKNRIFEQYLEAFQKGVYSHIKREYDPATHEIIIQKYFSGGFTAEPLPERVKAEARRSLAHMDLSTSGKIVSFFSSSSPMARRIVETEMRNLLPIERAEIEAELSERNLKQAKTGKINGTKSVTVRLVSSPVDGTKTIFSHLENVFSNESNTNPIADMRVVPTALGDISAMKNEKYYRDFVLSDIKIVSGDAGKTDVVRFASLQTVPRSVYNITDAGTLEKLDLKDGQLTGTPVNTIESQVTPILLAENSNAIEKFSAANPAVTAQIMILAATNVHASTGTPGNVRIAQNEAQEREAVREAVAKKSPVFKVTFGGLQHLSLGSSDQIERRTVVDVVQEFSKHLDAGVAPVIIAENENMIRRFANRESQAAGKMIALVASQNPISHQQISKAVSVASFEQNVMTALSDGAGKVAIPATAVTALKQRNPQVFNEAEQKIDLIQSNQMTIQQAQTGGIVEKINKEINAMTREYETASMDTKFDKFNQVQEAIRMRDTIEKGSANTPSFGLPSPVIAAIETGQGDIGTLRKIYTALNTEYKTLTMAANVYQSADLAQSDQSSVAAVQLNQEKVHQDIVKVSREIRKRNIADAFIAEIDSGKSGAINEFLAESQTIHDVSMAVAQIQKAAGPIYVINSDGRSVEKIIDRGEAAKKLLENNAVVHVKENGNITVVRVLPGTRALTPSQRAVVSAATDHKTNRVDLVATATQLTGKSNKVGGIDFNPDLLEMHIKRDGNGVILPISQQSLDAMDIHGFIPVIKDIRSAAYDLPGV